MQGQKEIEMETGIEIENENDIDIDDDDKNMVIIGQRLGNLNYYTASKGTYIRDSYIYASVIGQQRIIQVLNGKPLIEVQKEGDYIAVPQINDVVIVQIIRINPRVATAKILSVQDKALKESANAVIRNQNIISNI
eukprot:TRINITY_DN2822_c2_g1_i2.p1 TRINITY_DN2822_c2_g1~~TRINITY_DN2822_c2_g1_i2.p1  ORF type:complete len:136 (-),score=55.17 TRINITY_DN2822_c2_g1_i2:2-409(-)